MKVAIQGQVGSFHALVAQKWYGPNCRLVECRSFGDVFEAYDRAEAEAIVCAVENTVYGSINEVYQLIASSSAKIIGEVKLPIRQHLIGLADTDLANIRRIYSHPVALAQSHHNLRHLCPQAELIEYADTAAAVGHVKKLNRGDVAAVGSETAAELHKLEVIKSDVHDNQANLTRFLILEKTPQPHNANRSSLLVRTDHSPGALAEVLSVFAERRINLVKLQSQPIIGRPWQYNFFVVADCAGDELAECVEEINQTGHSVRVLGEYQASQ